VLEVGEKYRHLTVLGDADNGGTLCRCDCGAVRSYSDKHIKSGRSTYCKACRYKHQSEEDCIRIAQKISDTHKKNHKNRGEGNPSAKLTTELAVRLKKQLETMTAKEVYRRYRRDVSYETIYKIAIGDTWRHV